MTKYYELRYRIILNNSKPVQYLDAVTDVYNSKNREEAIRKFKKYMKKDFPQTKFIIKSVKLRY